MRLKRRFGRGVELEREKKINDGVYESENTIIII